jgi:hypothetical protein
MDDDPASDPASLLAESTRRPSELISTDLTARDQRFYTLRRLHAVGPQIIEAAAYLGSAGYRTYAGPQRFLGRDGRTYRVKSRAQEGHGAEFTANRFGSYLGVAPDSTVLSIDAAALPRNGSIDHLKGLQLGSIELDGVLNNDELAAFDVRLTPSQVDWDSWALVVCLQTWIYVRDPQAVIRIADGKCFSIDHGYAFSDLSKGPPSAVVVPPLRGVSDVAFSTSALEKAIREVEGISEDSILAMVTGSPEGANWRMSIEREFRTADFMLDRQPRLREVLLPWMPRLS